MWWRLLAGLAGGVACLFHGVEQLNAQLVVGSESSAALAWGLVAVALCLLVLTFSALQGNGGAWRDESPSHQGGADYGQFGLPQARSLRPLRRR